MSRSALHLLALLLALGCGEATDAPATPAAVSKDGTAAMVARLAAIVDSADAAPAPYFHRNRRRAEALRARLLRIAGPQALQLRYGFAQELLNAGDTRAAIVETEDLLRQMGLRPEQIGTADAAADPRASGLSAQTKPLVDLLALSHLRLAEQTNCLLNHNGAVCILPFAPEAEHADPAHARTAIRLYTALARGFPDDLGARYLLNLAHVAVGTYPEGVPADFRVPGLARPANAALPRFANVAPDLGLDVNGLSGGVSVADFDGDGHLDLFMSAYGLDENVRLFLADGAGGYRDHTRAAGLDGIVSGLNTTHADVDNDGDTDVLVLRGAWLGAVGNHPNSLLRNEGDGTFVDVTVAAGLDTGEPGGGHPTQVAAWADVDRDGDLDLFVGNESMGSYADLGASVGTATGQRHPSHLFLNDGTGAFTEAAANLGLAVDAFVKGAAFGDADGDGWPDLYVSVLGGDNLLFLNRDGQRFEEVAARAGVEAPAFSFPTWWWDYDHDGDDDLFVISYDARYFQDVAGQVAREFLGRPSEAERPRLYRNDGPGADGTPTFTDATAAAGLDRVVFGMGSNLGDLDGDGWLDAYVGTGAPDLRSLVPNRMFLGSADGTFQEVTMDGGFGHLQKGHGVAFADLDRDGDQDVYAVMGGAVEGDVFPNALFENPGFGHAHVTLHLEGDPHANGGRGANRSAIGARVRLTVEDAAGNTRTLTRTVGTGGSFGANPLPLTVGLGDAAQLVTVAVTWPDAASTTTTYDALDLGGTYRLVQGRAPAQLDRPPVPFRFEAAAHHAGPVR